VATDAGVGLPVGWPSSVAARESFAHHSEVSGLSKDWWTTGSSTLLWPGGPGGAELRGVRGTCQRIIIDPNAKVHVVFSLCSTVVLMYDVFIVPFMLAWELPLGGVTLVLSACVACFWTLDVLMTFLSGYHSGGAVVMDPSRIARHYVSTWFLPDVVVVASDWLSILLLTYASQVEGSSTDSLSILRFTKLSRLLKAIAVFRMVKFAVVLENYMEKRLSESYRIVIKIAGAFCGTLWLGHILTCLFFVIGRSAPSNTGARWIDDVSTIGDRSIAFLDGDITYQYITSYHWTVAQITMGSMGINANNTSERLFSIFMLMLGLLFGATMVSSLSASMVDYQMLAKDKKEKLRALRRYLRENCVDHRVAVLVQQQAAARLWKRARLAAKDVHALGVISVSLRAELHFELCRRHVVSHALFRFWADTDASMARNFCFECASFAFPMPGDDVFLPGTVTDASYLVVSGKLNYTQVPGSSPATDPRTAFVGAGQWLCEAALWSHWIHVGTLQAETECQLFVVCAKELDSVLRRNRVLRDVTTEYCRRFHERITSAKPPHAPWPDDIGVPFTEYCDIVARMDEARQATIGLAALEQMATSWGWHRGFEQLRAEVREGRSTMTINGRGDFERIVALVVVRIERGDGSIWAQIGEQEHSDVACKCACQLPSTKQQHGEPLGDTAMGILEDLGFGERDVEILGTERDDEWQESRKLGVRTKYLRTVCRARLRSDVGAPSTETQRLPEARRTTRASTTSTWGRTPAVAAAPQRDAFVRRRAGRARFYAWLTPAELRQLQGPAGEAVLAAWLVHGSASPPEEAGRGGDGEGDAAGEANPVEGAVLWTL